MAAFGASFEAETMHKQAGNNLSYYFSALGCALDAGRTAISMRRKTGNGEHNRNKLDLTVAHCRWGKIGIRGNCRAAPQMSGSTAIHGTFSIIGCCGEGRLRFWSGRIMVVMLVHRAITVVCCYRMAGNCFACPGACSRHHRREHGRNQSKNHRDG